MVDPQSVEPDALEPDTLEPSVAPQSVTTVTSVAEPDAAPTAPSTPATAGTPSTPDPGASLPVVAGAVTVAVGAPAFATGQAVTSTIANGLAQTIYTSDMKSDCTIAILERWDGANWTPLLACGLERLPMVNAIAPGQGRTATIDPRSSHFQALAGPAGPAVGAGTYRIKFSYRLVPDRGVEESLVSYSAMFRIGA